MKGNINNTKEYHIKYWRIYLGGIESYKLELTNYEIDLILSAIDIYHSNIHPQKIIDDTKKNILKKIVNEQFKNLANRMGRWKNEAK